MNAAEREPPPAPARATNSRSPFVRLRELLGDAAPGKPAISLAVGEPQHPVPGFVGPVLAAHIDEFGRYPMNKGIEPFCRAAADWLGRRFVLPRPVDPDTEVLVLNGTREGLFLAAIAARNWVSGRAGRPAILMPNPFYAAYAAGAVAADCEPVYLPATGGDRIPARSRGACGQPARPHGRVLHRIARQPPGRGGEPGLSGPAGRARPALRLSGVLRRMLFGDLFAARAGRDARNRRSGLCQRDRVPVPVQALEPAGAAGRLRGRRSQIPGPLPRSAQCRGPAGSGAGPAGRHRGLCGRGPCGGQPRALHAANSISPIRSSATATVIGVRPAASFSGSTCRRRGATRPRRCSCGGEAGLRVVPGRYLAQPQADGSNPGEGFIRVAMVHDHDTTAEALHRLVAALG